MSHSWDCPDEYEARRRADRDAGYDAREHGSWGPFHRSPYECQEANEAYQREYRYEYERQQEEIAMERRQQEQRRFQREQEEYEMQQAYWAEEERQAMERDFNEQMERERAEAAASTACRICDGTGNVIDDPDAPATAKCQHCDGGALPQQQCAPIENIGK